MCIFSVQWRNTLFRLKGQRTYYPPPHSGAIIGGRGYFSSGGDFDLKTTFYGLVLLNMTERQLPEVSADIKTISVRQEIRSGRPFKVYAHYMLLSTV